MECAWWWTHEDEVRLPQSLENTEHSIVDSDEQPALCDGLREEARRLQLLHDAG